MRGSHLAAMALCVLAAFPWIARAETEGPGERPNLLYNSDFERMREGHLDGWFGGDARASAEARRSGRCGASLRPGSQISALGIASVPTLKYDVGGWFRSAEYGACGMRVDFYGVGGLLVKSVDMPLAEARAGDEWTHITRRVAVPFGAGGFAVSVYNDGAEYLSVDDVYCAEVYQARLKRTSEPPAVDGVLDDACWENACVGDEPWITVTGTIAKQQTRVFACYDDNHLYIAFRLYTSKPNSLKAEETRDDFYVWRDDSAEVFIDPGHDHRTYCELEVNANNVEYDAWCFDKDWECIWEHAVGTEADAWTCEIAIDLASFEYRDRHGNPTGRMRLPRADVWGINFSRNDYVSGESSSWPNSGRSFHNAPAYGHLLNLEPLRTDAYRAQATATVASLRQTLAGYEVSLAEIEPKAGHAEENADDMNGKTGLRGPLAEELQEIETMAAEAESYEDWLDVERRLDSANGGFAVVSEMAQSALARARWQRKTGQPVGIGVSYSTEPALEEGPPVVWGTANTLSLAIGRDDVTGFCLSVDAYRDTAGVQADVSIPGLFSDRAAIICAPDCDDRKSAQWPAKPIKLGSGSRALLWVPIRSEVGTKPGVYHGTATVTADGHPALVQPFTVKVLDICVPRSETLSFSALRPSFAALDITSELAGFGVENGSAAVSHIPAPADGQAYSDEEMEQIAADAAALWRESRIARPEMDRYILGARGIASMDADNIRRLYDVLDDAIDDLRIMQLIATAGDIDAIPRIERRVDIWAAPANLWGAVREAVDEDAECWLYCEFPGKLHANGFAEARIQPMLARHLGADGIVWGMRPDQPRVEKGEMADETEYAASELPFPVFEMCCRMIAIGHRDCDYFEYIYDELLRERLSTKGGHHWRLAANARMAARIYPTLVIAPEWYTTDYRTLSEHRDASQMSVERIQRHLLPLVRE